MLPLAPTTGPPMQQSQILEKQMSNNGNDGKRRDSLLAIGIGIDLAIGAAADNIALGLALGTGTGNGPTDEEEPNGS